MLAYTLLVVVMGRRWSIGEWCEGACRGVATIVSVDDCDNDLDLGFPV